MNVEISVIVLCYNPNLDKLKKTLKSILQQKEIAYEIIISDDGSKQKNYGLISSYFEDAGFDDFTILENKENQGTVKNAMEALKCAKGKYIKLISPGDYLYNDTCLSRLCMYMESKKSKICYGKAVYYKYNESNLDIYPMRAPINQKIYKKNNIKKIQRNYLFFRDKILGASLVLQKDTTIYYFEKICQYVKYAEDLSVICMVADGEKIDFWDEYLIWYEYGTGISTNGVSKWTKIISKEEEHVFKNLINNYDAKDQVVRFTYDENVGFIKRMRMQPAYIFYLLSAYLLMFYSKRSINCRSIDKNCFIED